MKTEKNHRMVWRASICIGLIAIAALLLAFIFDGHFFGRHDPFNHRAYIFGGSVATLAALAIGFGIRGIEVRANRAGSVVGLLLGTLALLASALFLFGTMLPGD